MISVYRSRAGRHRLGDVGIPVEDAMREYLAVADEQLRGEEIREIDIAV